MSKRQSPKFEPGIAVPQPPAYAYAYPTAYAPPPAPTKLPEPHRQSSAQILQDRNATVAKVSIDQTSSFDFGTPPDFSFIATGSSKREQGDRFNARTGELLALSRAYLNLSRQLYAAGKALVEPEYDYDAAAQAETDAADAVAPEDNFLGVGAYPDIPVLQDPTDEDVELAKRILQDRADYDEAVASLDADEPFSEAQQAQLDHAVLAFNSAAEALNNVRNVLGQFV